MAWDASPTVGTWQSAYATNPTLNMTGLGPSGSGGILLLLVNTRAEPTAFVTPSGWTDMASVESSRCAVYARVSDGTASDEPTVSITSGVTCCAAVITRWQGGNTDMGTLLHGTPTTLTFIAELSPDGNIVCPAITPTVNNCLVLRGGYVHNDDPAFTTPSSGDTFLTNVLVNLTDDISTGWQYRIQTTATAVTQADMPNGAASAVGYSVAVALTAAVSGGGKRMLMLGVG